MHFSASFGQPQPQGERTWQPRFWKGLPILGLSSLLTAILCALAAGVMLASCNDVEINQWPSKKHTFQPTVILAVFETANQVAMRFTLMEAVKCAWRIYDGQGGKSVLWIGVWKLDD